MARSDEKKITICYSDFKCFKDNQITSKEFLLWAKSDLSNGEKRRRGNALGNIKKAIHSRIDEIIMSTHITLAKDWKWDRANTEIKLRILKKLGIEHTPIAKIITDIRNRYEHQYILPKKLEVEAHYSTAKLWIDDSYKKYGCNRIGIANLYVTEIFQHNNEVIKIALPGYREIVYFWDHKKEIHKSKKKGPQEIMKLSDMTWEEILKEEKSYIKDMGKSEGHYYLPGKKLTKLFSYCDTKISRKFKPFFSLPFNLETL